MRRRCKPNESHSHIDNMATAGIGGRLFDFRLPAFLCKIPGIIPPALSRREEIQYNKNSDGSLRCTLFHRRKGRIRLNKYGDFDNYLKEYPTTNGCFGRYGGNDLDYVVARYGYGPDFPEKMAARRKG